MENKRLERYIEKLEHFKELVEKLDNWTKHLNEEIFLVQDLKDQFAIYHAFQIIVEISTDLIAMITKDLQLKPKDDYSNIKSLSEKGILSAELSESLTKLNGLRNVIVHDYNGFDDLLAFKGMRDNFPSIKEFYKVIQEWLTTKF